LITGLITGSIIGTSNCLITGLTTGSATVLIACLTNGLAALSSNLDDSLNIDIASRLG